MPVSGDLGGGGGSWCPVSPTDMAGQIENFMSRIEALEQKVAELETQNTEAIQLSDITNSAGWIYDVVYMGTPGWTQTPAGTLIPPADGSFTVTQILADAQANQLNASGNGASSFTWAQVSILGSNNSITAINELVDTSNIISVSSPNIYIRTSGLYLFGFWDSLSINVTAASYGFMEVFDPNFLLPGQSTVATAGQVLSGSTSGTKFASIGSCLVSTVPSGNFQLTAQCSRLNGTWSHVGALSILKLL